MVIAFARERSEWEKVADRAGEGLFVGMTLLTSLSTQPR
jgi:hypothetical protein